MNTFERRSTIKDLLGKQTMVQVRTLSEVLGVSEVSVRRDLESLEKEGFLRRIRGGAVLADRSAVGPPFATKLRLQAEQKRAIGRRVAGMIRPGEHLMLDSGTTVLEVARHLPLDSSITVITGSLPVIQALGHRRGFEVVVIGGQFYPEYETALGPAATNFLRDLNADRFIVAADGLTIERGITTNHFLEAELMRAMADAAAEVILATDSTKIGRRGFVTALPVERLHYVVTDSGIPDGFARELEALGLQVVIAA